MRLYRIQFVAFVLMTMFIASCSVDETNNMDSSTNTIRVTTYVQSTRALDKTAFEENDIIGLYACHTSGDYKNSFTANFMDNVAVTNNGTEWTYSPPMAWIEDNEQHLSFIAYYPRITDGTALTYPFTVNKNAEEQIDPLWCTVKDASIDDRNGTTINGVSDDASFQPNSGPLNLKFKHMLSKVKLSVKLNNAYQGINATLNSMTLSNVYTNGVFNMNANLTTGTWGSLSEKSDFNIHPSSAPGITLTDTEQQVGELLMIPQSLASNVAIDITYTHDLYEGGETTVTKTIFLPERWVMSKIYNYVVNISLEVENITISADIKDWDADNALDFSEEVTQAAQAVDLGLSVKWASSNLVSGSCSLFAWGDVNVKSSFAWSNYMYCNGAYNKLTKYVSHTTYANSSVSLDNRTSLIVSDDVARFRWGGTWRIPSNSEWRELISECTWEWGSFGGTRGYMITGPNGNNIFLPVTGYKTTSDSSDKASKGYYWSSDRYTSLDYQAYDLEISQTSIAFSQKDRAYGLAVRPVMDITE